MRTKMNGESFRKSLLALALVAGCGQIAPALADPSDPTPHSDSVGAAITDTAITTKVKAGFVGKDALKKSDIDVTTTNGVVTLTGTASSSDAKSTAVMLAKNVDGVKSVDDELKTPEVPGSMSAKAHTAEKKVEHTASDSWITTKVKSDIAADDIGKGLKVGVTTKHGVVMLKGKLSNEDAIDHVKDIAEKVKGVKSVDTSALVVASN